MSRRRRREGASNCVEHHFSQVQTQAMSLFGMHFYGMAVSYNVYTWKFGHTLRVYRITHTIEVHSKFGHGLINLAEMMFHWHNM